MPDVDLRTLSRPSTPKPATIPRRVGHWRSTGGTGSIERVRLSFWSPYGRVHQTGNDADYERLICPFHRRSPSGGPALAASLRHLRPSDRVPIRQL
jgi:hypothetical protein